MSVGRRADTAIPRQQSRMRAASTAAFFALSTPTHATGTPGGIWAIESSASSPPRDRHRRRERHADDRQLGVRGDHARQRRRQPGAGDDHAQAAHLARSSRSRPPCPGRGARTSRAPRGGCRAPRAPWPPSPSRACRSCEPMTMPTRGASTSMPVELGLDGRLGGELGGCRLLARSPRSAMSLRSWRPSNSIMSAAAYAASRAARTSAPERGHVEHAPARGDDLAAAPRRCPRGCTSTPAGTSSSPEITSPERRRLAGSRREASTTRHRRALVPLQLDARRGRRARSRACSRSSRSERRRGSTTCVSGSPKRALNSSTRGAVGGRASARRRGRRGTACRGRAARRSPAGGRSRRSRSSSCGSISATGENAPMPPVFGPGVAVADALEVARGRERQRPLAVAQREHATARRRRRNSSTSTGWSPKRRCSSIATSARARLRLVGGDHDALAGRQPVGLDHRRVGGRSPPSPPRPCGRPSGRRSARRPPP